MAGTIKHKKASAYADGGDAAKVQPSDWNASLDVSGGSHGDVMTRDTGATDGWSLVAAVWKRTSTNITPVNPGDTIQDIASVIASGSLLCGVSSGFVFGVGAATSVGLFQTTGAAPVLNVLTGDANAWAGIKAASLELTGGLTLGGTLHVPAIVASGIIQGLSAVERVDAMVGPRVLTTANLTYQFLNPNGSDRDVTLPDPAPGLTFLVMHIGSGNTLTVKDYPQTSTVTTVTAGQSKVCIYDGAAWRVI